MNKRDIVIVGGGSGGIAAAASLLKRQHNLKITIIEPSDKHYYQPAWTLVGAGEFDAARSVKPMADCMPQGVEWIQAAVKAFEPEQNRVLLNNGNALEYNTLVVAPELQLNWKAIPGLEETLGKNGVTSNYRFDLAPYTWELVQKLKSGRAIFTQPPMPIKCAGAPQKAMYLSCSQWENNGALSKVEVEFNNAGGVLFGVADFIPPLMKYVERYHAKLNFNTTLVEVDGPAKKAWFNVKDADGNLTRVEQSFELLHVVPPQSSPDFIKQSPLANPDGWLEVNQTTLQHARYPNIFGVGDVLSSPNAKTVAAARQQVVIVARNVLAQRANIALPAVYDGYGACPLTVEKGKIVLAEFGYGGKLLPTFPLDPLVPRRAAWVLKKTILPWVYWRLMLKGREWLAKPG
jgi:sulfide:quinone oxidoreductase